MRTKKYYCYSFLFYLPILLLLQSFSKTNNSNSNYHSSKILIQATTEKRKQYPDTITTSYLTNKNLDKSLSWADSTLSQHPNLSVKVKLFRMLSEIYFRKKSYALAMDYRDSVNITEKRLDKIKNNKALLASKAQFDLQEFKKEIANKEISIQNDRRILYSILSGILLSIFLLLFLLLDRKQRNKTRKIIAERDRNILELKLQKETDDRLLLEEKQKTALLEQQRLKTEVELKNQKISSKALFISGRNEILQNVLKSISKLPELSKNKVLFRHIRSLKNHIKTDNDWDNFIKHFEEINHGFLKNLKQKHPDLNSNDIRFISYIYMHLNSKEIAIINNITLEACRKRKERIIIKLNIPEDTSLSDYLQIFN